MKISLILGGARSGKSRYGESLSVEPKFYFATAQAFDDEMRSRIALHQKRRGGGWVTVDTPIELAATLQNYDAPKSFILVDCLTLWLTNVMLAELDWEHELEQLLTVLGTIKGQVVLVSNEVGQGIVPENAMARKFRDIQGLTNQSVAEIADTVVMMVAGLPMTIKSPSRPRIGPPLA
jgi:adenosylcobinamide kinase / adenosylcobinamide-phosphate guanylyltransferase